MFPRPPSSTLFPYTTLFRSELCRCAPPRRRRRRAQQCIDQARQNLRATIIQGGQPALHQQERSEEHTSELQSQSNLVCRLLLEKKKKIVPKKLYHRATSS